MSLFRAAGVFLSGFLVYGLVSVATKPSGNTLGAFVDPVPAARADPGSRLKQHFLLGDDGSKDYQITLVHWIPKVYGDTAALPEPLYLDSTRGEDCAFTVGGDGVRRCLPIDRVEISFATYSDAACTQRAFAIPDVLAGCTIHVPKYASYAVREEAGVCGVTDSYYPTHVYTVGSFLGPNHICYGISGGVCSQTECANSGNGNFATYAVDGEIAATSFVGVTATQHD